MIEQYYTCELLTDVVLNSKLATEGNMTTLDFIPGSTFLGVVAKSIYQHHKDWAYPILHTGEVSFGDAYISNERNEISYPMPFSLFKDKVKQDKIWLHHLLNNEHFKQFKQQGIQLKQERNGYFSFTPSGLQLKISEKNFAIKSAQDRKERRSKDGAMFGFESLAAQQYFVFSVRYEKMEYQEIVENYLLGNQRIGKSKTAQFGQVCIKKLEGKNVPQKIDTLQNNNYTLVYAESNLCFFNEYGQSTFQPKAEDLDLPGGTICWEKSQVRTYSYSPWNGLRNTPNTQRDCILKGSVFYVKGAVAPEVISKSVGEYQAEGLGRVIYNPAFLKGDESTGEWQFEFIKSKQDGNSHQTESKPKETAPTTALGAFLLGLKEQKQKDLQLSLSIQRELNSSSKHLKSISSSQWGAVRAYATKAENLATLRKDLFEDFLMRGVAAERYWNKHQNRENLQAIFEKNQEYGTVFLAKYAAEMAKVVQKQNN